MQHWYLGPILDFSSSYADTLSKLRRYIAENDITRVALIGSSMGGFAAMKLGSDISADLVLAFAPQTCLQPAWRERALDRRWSWKMSEIANIGYNGLDVRNAYLSSAPASTILFYDASLYVDRQHARHIEDLPGVELIAVEGGHHVATPLAKAGEITRRLKQFESALLPARELGADDDAVGSEALHDEQHWRRW
ncbi:MAG: hypothetical protein K0M60_09105 [Hydrogenophaga sp.]|nr:hypothetical protein [Hydrogenophaga sp.]